MTRLSAAAALLLLVLGVPTRAQAQGCYIESPRDSFPTRDRLSDDERRIFLRELKFYFASHPQETLRRAERARGACVKLSARVTPQDPRFPNVYLWGPTGQLYRVRMAPSGERAASWQEAQWDFLATYSACVGRPVAATFAASFRGVDPAAKMVATSPFEELATTFDSGVLLAVQSPKTGKWLSMDELAAELRKLSEDRFNECQRTGRTERW